MNYYPHHIGDFNNATRHLTRIERSIYRDLIELYYDTEQPLTLDLKILCRRIIARTEEESTAVQQVLNEFFTETEQGWYHERCEREIDKYHGHVSAKSAAGRASAAKRAQKLSKSPSNSSTDVQQPFNECSNSVQLTKNQEPITNNQEPLKEEKEEPQSDDCLVSSENSFFDTFWSAYPLKTGKEAARKAFKKIKKPSEVLPVILLALQWQVDTRAWRSGYIPHPSKYLNDGRWQDERPPDNVFYNSRKDDFPNRNKTPQRENFIEKDYGTGVMDL